MPDDPRAGHVHPEQTAGSVPFDARRAMQKAIWEQCIAPGDNEWTTWTDAIALAECAAAALTANGWALVDRGQPTEPTEADPQVLSPEDFEHFRKAPGALYGTAIPPLSEDTRRAAYEQCQAIVRSHEALRALVGGRSAPSGLARLVTYDAIEGPDYSVVPSVVIPHPTGTRVRVTLDDGSGGGRSAAPTRDEQLTLAELIRTGRAVVDDDPEHYAVVVDPAVPCVKYVYGDYEAEGPRPPHGYRIVAVEPEVLNAAREDR